jgi:hypothetical protein
MTALLPLLTLFVFATAEDPKPEDPPAVVKDVLDKYLKAVIAKDHKAMAALADVPWLDRDRQLIKDRTGLDKAVSRVASQLPEDKGERKVDCFPYKKIRDRIQHETERKQIDEALGDNGWLIFVEEEGYPLSERTILIRIKGAEAAVVGGPLKQNQLSPHNRIPEVVDRLLDKAEVFEVYSLDPDSEKNKEGNGKAAKNDFHGWTILGKTEVKGDAKQKRLSDALRLAAEDNFGMVANCFIPRHGMRLKGDGKTVDMVICFQCLSVKVFVNGEQKYNFLVTHDPQESFDTLLKDAGVKLPKQAKE